MMTDAEHEAVDMLGRAYTFIVQNVIADGPTKDADVFELAVHIHNAQHMVMAQSAGRDHPDKYRLLGSTVSRPE